MSYIPRAITPQILEAQPFFPITIITGPRQVGKTTLCKHIFEGYTYVNLEDQDTRARALADTKAWLDSCGDHVIIDEVQRLPELTSAIQVRVDQDRSRRYILTGSNHFVLLNNSSQSLAGRAAVFTLMPFAFDETPPEKTTADTDSLMWCGFYPGPLIDGAPPTLFYRSYYNTYIERDLRQLSQIQNLDLFQIFIRLCAGRTGTEFKAASLAGEVGVSAPTIQQWLSLLKTSYVVYTVRPYFSNLRKRLTRTPKIYFYDTGLLCYLLGIVNPQQLAIHPLRGAVFENLAMSQIMKWRYNKGLEPDLNFYRESSGREVDILLNQPRGVDLYEVKAAKSFHADFLKTMEFVSRIIPEVQRSVLIYDGDTMPPVMYNVRDIDTAL